MERVHVRKKKVIKTATWNLNLLPRAASLFAKNPEARGEMMADFLTSHFVGYDILGLQEVFDPRARKTLVAQLNSKGFRIVDIPEDRSEWGSGLLIATKLNIGDVKFEAFSGKARGALEDLLVKKGIAAVKLNANTSEGEVDFLLTHLQPYFGMWPQAVREAQVRQLAQVSESINGPQIIAGDFNIDRKGRLTGGETKEFDNLQSVLGVDAPLVDEAEANHTSIWHPDKIKKAAGNHPDHIFTKGTIDTSTNKIIDYRTRVGKGEFLSDHLPVVSDIELKK